MKRAQPFKLEGKEVKDTGCELSRTCAGCPYESGTLQFSARCKEEYPNGVAGLVADIKRSVISSMYNKGISVTILARIFNSSTTHIRMHIHRYGEHH